MTISVKMDTVLLLVMIAAATAVFAFDAITEKGIADGVPYIGVVWLAYYHRQRHWILVAAIVCCLLTVFGYFVSPPGSEVWKSFLNRGLCVFAIALTAVLCNVAQRTQQRLRNSEENLQLLVSQRTDELARSNAELQISNEQLEQRNDELICTRDSLEQSNTELQQFAYVASHDLQSPLRAIAGFAQFLEKDYQDKLDESAGDYLRRIVDAAKRMQTLINDLLAYARVDARAVPFRSTSLAAVFDDVVELLQVDIADVGGRVTRDDLPTVNGDPSQLSQLLQNLISNGLKYHGQSPPHVQVSAQENGGEWVVSVQDNGIGIESKHHDRIFEIFRRLHSQDQIPGTGIGLAVCRRIANRHGGRIWVESVPGNGTTFSFSIPVQRSQIV